jgi:hypothetical protein
MPLRLPITTFSLDRPLAAHPATRSCTVRYRSITDISIPPNLALERLLTDYHVAVPSETRTCLEPPGFSRSSVRPAGRA